MSGVSIPREAVEAAARQIHTGFEHAAPIEQAHARETAMDALNAAAPLIVAAELERIVKSIDTGDGLAADDYWNRAVAEGRKTLKLQLASRVIELRAQA